MTTPSRPLCRGIAVLILVALLATTYAAVVAPILDRYRSAHHSIAQSTRLLVQYRARERDEAALKADLDRLTVAGAGDGRALLDGRNATLVAADLQDRLQNLLASVGGRPASIQTLPAGIEGRFERVTIRTDAQLSLRSLQDMLYDLEAGMPVLFVDDVDVGAIARGGGGNSSDDLVVRFSLYGYMRSERP